MANSKRTAFYDGAAPASGGRLAVFDKANNAYMDLDKPSADCKAMAPYWERVNDIVDGSDAIRAAGEKYLPKFDEESDETYKSRLALSKFTNVYRDIVENLASKPFASEEITFVDDTAVPEVLKTFVENVDGGQNNITTFSNGGFFHGINDAMVFLFIDYPDVPPTATGLRSVAEEQAAGYRPYWSIVRAMNVLEARSTIIADREVLTYARVLEREHDGDRIRIMVGDGTVAVWEVYKRRDGSGANGSTVWDYEKGGSFSIGIIPLVPIIFGRRSGRRFRVSPPMRDAADLQIELYWQESALKHIKALAAFPMLSGNGVSPAKDAAGNVKKLKLAPMTALYAPPGGNGQSGSWTLLEPSASSMTFLQNDVKETVLQLREIGRQPLTAQSGNVTVITSAVAAAKGNTAVQSWAQIYQDGIDRAMYVTGLWFGLTDAELENVKLNVFKDFDIDNAPAEQLSTLVTMRDKRDLSQKTYWFEMRRRGVLNPDFDDEKELEELLAESPSSNGADGLAGSLVPPNNNGVDPNNPTNPLAPPVAA